MGQLASHEHSGDPFRLNGTTAIVTGASKGIGRAIALRFAEAGADVGLIARTRQTLTETASNIKSLGGRAFCEVCDVTDLEALENSMTRLPAPDIFVNNAGRNVPQRFLEVDMGTFDAMFEVNIRAAFFAAQIAARRMLAERGKGVIVNLSSQAGHVGLLKRTVYCASKHALEGLTKTMALELAPNIRVVSVAPTFIETPMTKPFLEEREFRSYIDSNLLVSDVGTVEDVANAVLYVASPAAKLMTGTSLLIDGGWTAH